MKIPELATQSRPRLLPANHFEASRPDYCVSDEKRKSQFLVMIAKNFPVASCVHGTIELVLQTPASPVLRARNTAQARPAREVERRGVPALPVRCPDGESRGRSLSGSRRRPTDRILFPVAETVSINFQNRNERRGRLSCAYQYIAEAAPELKRRIFRVNDLCSRAVPNHSRRTAIKPRDEASGVPDARLLVEVGWSRASRRPKRAPVRGLLCRARRLPAVESAVVHHRHRVHPMRRHFWALLMLLLAAALPLSAAATNICESNLAAPDGTPLAGGLRDSVGILVAPSTPFSAADGSRVDQVPARVRVVNGAFCVALEPNDTAVPSQNWYVARWQLAGGAPRTECWYVPTSGSTVGLSAVVVSCANPVPGSECVMMTWAGLSADSWGQVSADTWGALLCQ
jgi:hypothetical protein